MRCFVDIGAHIGQTLLEAVKPRWGFDRIYAVEPMPREFDILYVAYGFDPRVELLNVALSDAPGPLVMYGANVSCESSIFPEKDDVDADVRTNVTAIRASDYIGAIDGELFVKINAEGAEVPILNDLLDSGVISRVDHLLVDMDIRKVPGWGPDAADRLLARLEEAQVNVREGFPYGVNHQARIGAWLAGEGL